MPDERTAADYQEPAVINLLERIGGRRPPGPPLQPPEGGGPFDGMEPRVARLEADVGHIKGDIADMKKSLGELLTSFNRGQIDFARLDANVAHLPSKGFIVSVATVGMGAVIAILTILSRLGVLAAH